MVLYIGLAHSLSSSMTYVCLRPGVATQSDDFDRKHLQEVWMEKAISAVPHLPRDFTLVSKRGPSTHTGLRMSLMHTTSAFSRQLPPYR